MGHVHVEHEAKALLAAAGVPIPAGRLARTPREAVAAATALGGSVMLKAQVARTDRAADGGIAIADGPAEAGALARAMLAREVQGAPVRVVLVEEHAAAEGELYVGAVYDPLLRSPVLVASRAGGTGVEGAATLREAFSPTSGCPVHVARRLGRRLDLRGKVLLGFADVAVKLADVFLALDAELLEINPLLIVGDGVLAVDAHLALDAEAAGRHPERPVSSETDAPTGTDLERAAAEIDASDHRGVAGRVVEFGGPVGLLIGGGGASLTVFDAVLRSGLEPFNYCEIGGNPTPEKVARLTALLLDEPRVERLAVVMNVVNNTRADLIAEGVVAGCLAAGKDPSEAIAAFRIPGYDESACRAILEEHGVEYLDQTVSLEGAVDRVARAMVAS